MNEINQLLVAQVTKEFQNSHFYLVAASSAAALGLNGIASFFIRQSDEEREHGMLIYGFLTSRGVTVLIGEMLAVDPAEVGGTALDMFKGALVAEQRNTGTISDIYFAALKARDFLASTFLSDMLKEQSEEEAWAHDAIARLTAAGDNTAALLLVDQEFARIAEQK